MAITPFVVKDIRVEGIQRTEAGTVFSYLPVRVGDTFNDEKATAAIKALYATGFFRDVRIEPKATCWWCRWSSVRPLPASTSPASRNSTRNS
jgi:outer membrane translocation and assembly module TamA